MDELRCDQWSTLLQSSKRLGSLEQTPASGYRAATLEISANFKCTTSPYIETYHRLDEVFKEAIYPALPASILVGKFAGIHIDVAAYQSWVDRSRLRVEEVRLRFVCLLSIFLITSQIRQSMIFQDDRAVYCSVAGASKSLPSGRIDPEVRQAGRRVEYWRQEIGECSRTVQTGLHLRLVVLIRVWNEARGNQIICTQQSADQANGCIESIDLRIASSIEILRRDVCELTVNDIFQTHDNGGVYAIDDDQAPAARSIRAGLRKRRIAITTKGMISVVVPCLYIGLLSIECRQPS